MITNFQFKILLQQSNIINESTQPPVEENYVFYDEDDNYDDDDDFGYSDDDNNSTPTSSEVTEPVASTSNLSTSQEVIKNCNNENTSCVHEHESTQSTLEENITGVNSSPSDNVQSQNLQPANDNSVIENNNNSVHFHENNELAQATVVVNLPDANTSRTSAPQLGNQDCPKKESNSFQNVNIKIKEEYDEVSLILLFTGKN